MHSKLSAFNEKIPFIVGVTGHRDLVEEEIPLLEKKLKEILQSIQMQCPHTPVALLTALAEGADRLAARIALKLGMKLHVVMPMEKPLYEEDFHSEESLNEFRNLLNSAEFKCELPFFADNSEHSIQASTGLRERQYSALGAFLANHSQILIALWDGRFSSKTGGTSEVVRFRLGIAPIADATDKSLLAEQAVGVVYHISTNRKTGTNAKGELNYESSVGFLLRSTKTHNILFPTPLPESLEGNKQQHNHTGSTHPSYAEINNEQVMLTSERSLNNITKGLDMFNRDISTWDDPGAIKDSRSFLFPPGKNPDDIPGIEKIVHFYGYADVLASFFQRKTVWALKALLGAGVLGFFFFVVYEKVLSKWYVLALFPIVFGVGALLSRLSHKRQYEDRFYDYRALAEGLRIQFFWALASLPDRVCDSYLHKFKGEFTWVREGIKNLSLRLMDVPRKGMTAGDSLAKLQILKDCWIDDQRKYFTKKVIEKETQLHRQERFTKMFFILAMLLVFSLLLFKVFVFIRTGGTASLFDMSELKNWEYYYFVLASIKLSLAVGAVRAGYVEKRAFSEELRQYGRMAELFARASLLMSHCLSTCDYKRAQRLVIELGQEALAENGDWLVLHRSRPLEMSMH